MMEYYEMLKNFQYTGTLGIITYWLPFLLCAIGYTGRTVKQIRNIKAYSVTKDYEDDLTVGSIFWRIVCTVTPVLNILALFFSIGWGMFSEVVDFIEKVFTFKLVKKSFDSTK